MEGEPWGTRAGSGLKKLEVSLCSLCELVGCWYIWLEAVLLVRETRFCSWVWGELENRSHCSLSVGFVDHAHPLLFVLFKAVRRGRQRVSQYSKRGEDLNTKREVNHNK